MNILKETFTRLASNYSDNETLKNELWSEIESAYSEEGRHYHTLTHLKVLLAQLTEVKTEINNWEITLFTLFYHDLVYNPLHSDNEEQSAEIAIERMKQLNVPKEMIILCLRQIIATKQHEKNEDPDCNYFLDADLSVLGSNWETYYQYAKNVRKEYAIYPPVVYNPGRKKVLQHFLEMERIFKMEHFFAKFEKQAKENLRREMGIL